MGVLTGRHHFTAPSAPRCTRSSSVSRSAARPGRVPELGKPVASCATSNRQPSLPPSRPHSHLAFVRSCSLNTRTAAQPPFLPLSIVLYLLCLPRGCPLSCPCRCVFLVARGRPCGLWESIRGEVSGGRWRMQRRCGGNTRTASSRWTWPGTRHRGCTTSSPRYCWTGWA